MRIVLFILLTYIAAVLDTSTSMGTFAPRWLLLTAAIGIVTQTDWRAIVWAAGCGLISDCLHSSSDPLGIDLTLASLMALAIQAAVPKRPMSLPLVLLLSLGYVFVVDTASTVSRLLIGGNALNFVETIESSLLCGVSSALLLTVGLMLTRRIVRTVSLHRHQPTTTITNQWKMLS
ncbi:MAG: hypothetical protein CMJ78_16635 [Planctomycetaceae bacterium]|nr:hypothetical protein [Planctomycetaceae bacterium]